MNKTYSYILILSVLLISGALGFMLSCYQHPHLPSRPNPPPVIRDYHYPTSFVKQITGDPKAGEKIFKSFCAACHDVHPEVDVNAPRINNKKFWENAEKELDMNVFLNMTIKGIRAMPARGGCFECSDYQLKLTIQYMVDQSKQH